jgi:hypothetical protein
VPALFDLLRKGVSPAAAASSGSRAYDHEEFCRVVREGVEQFSTSYFEKATWEVIESS